MISSEAFFSLSERKTRADEYQEEAESCLSEFSHSDESSRLDTESYRFVRLKYEVTNLSKPNLLRVWNKVTLESRYKYLTHSDIYKQWKHDNGDQKIGFTIF